jgi:hypothetical protein
MHTHAHGAYTFIYYSIGRKEDSGLWRRRGSGRARLGAILVFCEKFAKRFDDKATNGTSETHQTPTLQKQRADSYWQTVHPLGPCLQLVTEDTSTGHHGQRRRRRGAHLRTSTRSTSHARTHLRSITHATPQRAASPLLKLTGRGRPAQTTGSARARAC